MLPLATEMQKFLLLTYCYKVDVNSYNFSGEQTSKPAI